MRRAAVSSSLSKEQRHYNELKKNSFFINDVGTIGQMCKKWIYTDPSQKLSQNGSSFKNLLCKSQNQENES
jgi:hypothetical protein